VHNVLLSRAHMQRQPRRVRWTLLTSRAIAALCLLAGIAAALPVVVADVEVRGSGAELAGWPAALQIGAVVFAAAVLAGMTVAAAGRRHVDGPALLLLAFALALGVLPLGASALGGGRSPALHTILVTGIAFTALSLPMRMLDPRSRMAARAIVSVLVVVLEVAVVGLVSSRSLAPLAVGCASLVVALVAYVYIPPLLWRQTHPGTVPAPVAASVLIATAGIVAGGALLAAVAGERGTATQLGGVLGLSALAAAAVLLTLGVRSQVELGGDVTIDRPADRVFAAITDLRGDRPWDTRHIEVVGDDPIGVGTRLRVTVGGRESELTVSAFEPPHTFATESASPPVRGWTRYDIEAVGPDSSRLRWRQVLAVPLYTRSRPGFRRSVRRAGGTTVERYVACKRHLEAEPLVPLGGD